MNTGFIVYSIIMVWVLVIYGGLTYLVVKKREYGLISGFGNRSEEEQQYLLENGYVDATGRLLKWTFSMLLLTFLAGLLPVDLAFEVGLGLFFIVLLTGIVWIQRYEVPRKRKRNVWMTSIFSVAIFGGVVALTISGLIDNTVTVEDSKVKISGMYGGEWSLADIEKVEILDDVPDVIVKSNGFASGGHLKGRFRLEDPYEGALLFIQADMKPSVYIKTKEDDLFINKEDEEETRRLYETLKESVR
ncbi:DUF3784 domain-containing protein [Halobacillus sp. ACCC02827]|uniref:DUF3784 domain-containing protein n=1 Tax=Halobacillus sp. ACCC02827 TaxID=3052090 RepID=UPI0025704859|nr:DUF3784 domain-containing protein [Halobacillus sp. ACCC02827]WJE16474.1 DUF3784 domain-containing protein [Halobacillus sp. ACCC02827]